MEYNELIKKFDEKVQNYLLWIELIFSEKLKVEILDEFEIDLFKKRLQEFGCGAVNHK
ncbi:MAG: hypothetical protein ACRCUP_04755 [Mycoplasmatales bacterium]